MKPGPTIVVLAAGAGKRFAGAGHKLEQPLGANTVLGATLDTALETLLPVLVVTTQRLVALAARHVATRDVLVLPEADAGMGMHREAASPGMGHSIACAVAARPEAAGWLVMPADMPAVRSATLLAVAAALSHHAVTYAQFRGRRGHPVGFSPELRSELVALRGDEGARRLVARFPSYGVAVDDAGVLVDIDTADDLARFLRPSSDAPSGRELTASCSRETP